MTPGQEPREPEDAVELSIVIPARNEGDQLGEQLAALAAQRWGDRRWEVLVVDNMSTDATVDVARRYADQLPRLRIVTAAARPSLAYARNVDIAAAQADHIAICDADDVVADGWVAAMGRALEQHELVSGVLEVDRLNPKWLADSRGRRDPGASGLFHGHFPIASGGNLGLRRDVWERLGGFAEHVPGAEDIHFSMEAWRRGVKLHVEPAATLHYRFRDDLGSLWRQGRRYGAGRATVCKELRRAGFSTKRLAGWRSWLWVLLHVLDVRRREGRMRWAWVAANRIGQLEGSIRTRSLHI